MAEERAGSDAAAERPRGRGVPLADESPDELPALLAIGLGVAFLVIAIVWPGIQAGRDRAGDGSLAEEAAAADVDGAEDPDGHESSDGDDPAPESTGPDLPAIEAGLTADGFDGLTLSADGRVVTVVGEVADEAARAAVIDFVRGQPDVDDVIDGLTLSASADPGDGPDADITAAQRSIVLTGTVSDESTRDALVARAVEIYSADQVDDQLVVDSSLAPPTRVTITGSLTDPVLFDKVLNGFGDIEGVEVFQPSITLEESGELEQSLNSLAPIQFASGSDRVDEASVPILDEAAELLIANPDVAVEIGGHTDSIGSDSSNLGLSQDRADRVKAELEARGVTNELVAEGFGERRLRVPNDANDAEAQQMNRRIEFRVLG